MYNIVILYDDRINIRREDCELYLDKQTENVPPKLKLMTHGHITVSSPMRIFFKYSIMRIFFKYYIRQIPNINQTLFWWHNNLCKAYNIVIAVVFMNTIEMWFRKLINFYLTKKVLFATGSENGKIQYVGYNQFIWNKFANCAMRFMYSRKGAATVALSIQVTYNANVLNAWLPILHQIKVKRTNIVVSQFNNLILSSSTFFSWFFV